MSLPTCPKCGSQLEVKLTFASGPKSSGEPFSTDSIGKLLDAIDDGELDGKTLEFVTQTRERFAKYGATTRMSEKQMAWLQRIADGETGNEW